MNATNLTMLHDSDLEGMQTTQAAAVLAARSRGASLVRLTLARMYGSTKPATHEWWHLVPHVTERDTIGVVDVARGAAWDSMIPVDDDVRALGLDNEHTPDGNHPSLVGDVHFDGRLVQRKGEAPNARITAPVGWRRIGLPTWRGYDGGDGRHKVPEALYARDQQIRPQLRAVGLMTCYGYVGLPQRMLYGAAGWTHDQLPAWVHPMHQSPTIRDIPLADDIASDLTEAAREYLRACIRAVVRGTEIEAEVNEHLRSDDRQKLWRTLNPHRGYGHDRTRTAAFDIGGGLARSVFGSDVRFAADVLHHLSPPEQVGGWALYGMLQDAIEYVAAEQTRAARDAIYSALEARGAGRNLYTSGIESVFRPLVTKVMEFIAQTMPGGFEDTARDIMFRDGPIYLDIPAALYEAV